MMIPTVTLWEIYLIGTIVLLLCAVPLSILHPKNISFKDCLWLVLWPVLVVLFIIAAILGKERLDRYAAVFNERKGKK